MTGSHNHWLATQLAALSDLSRKGQRQAPGQTAIDWVSRHDREAFMDAIQGLTEQVAVRQGVLACVVGHEGLVISAAGDARGTEGLAAVTQQMVDTARVAAENASLGTFQQTLVVGDEYKIAMFWVGGMSIAIQARTGVDLATSLAAP